MMEYYGNNDWRDYKALSHYGVLGMKWGIRRYQPYSVAPRGSGKKGREIGAASRYDTQISRAKRKIEKNNVKIAKSKARLDSDKARKRYEKVKKLEYKLGKHQSNLVGKALYYDAHRAKTKRLEAKRDRINKKNAKEEYKIAKLERKNAKLERSIERSKAKGEKAISKAFEKKVTPIQSARIINKGRKTLNQQSKQALINELYSGIDKKVAKKAWETSDYEVLKKQIKDLNKGDITGYKEKIDYGSYKAKRPVTTGTLAVDIASKAYNESRKKRR